nr:unnamed protein product [Digitaria exilis]
MASSTKAAHFLVLALFVVSVVILPSSVCHGIRSAGLGSGSLDPDHPVCIGGACGVRGEEDYPPYMVVVATAPTRQHPPRHEHIEPASVINKYGSLGSCPL